MFNKPVYLIVSDQLDNIELLSACCTVLLHYPAPCWQCLPLDSETGLSHPLFIYLLLSLTPSLFFVPAAAEQVLAFPHSSVSLFCSTQLPYDLRDKEK